jgi:hypothetical protein
MAMNPGPSNPNSIPSLLRELRDQSTTLIRQEVTLAKTEIKESVSSIGNHIMQIALGGAVAYAGVIVFLIGIGHLLGAGLIRAGLDERIAQWLAPSCIGIMVAGVGSVMFSKAKRALAHDDILPHQTIDSLRETQ